MTFRGNLEGAWLMAVGIFVTIIAAGVQVSNALSFTFIWTFDHNGVHKNEKGLLEVAFLDGYILKESKFLKEIEKRSRELE